MAAEVHRYKVGDIEVTVLSDGFRMVPVNGNYLSNASADDLAKALAAAGQPTDKMKNTYSPIVLTTGGKRVLFDTGNGSAAAAESNNERGTLNAGLAAAGIDRNAIDVVVISHFHADHVNGLLMPDNSKAFPNAEIVVPEVEWTFWMDDGEMSRAKGDRMVGLFKNNRNIFENGLKKKVTPYEWNKEVAPGLTAVESVGHTPGHTSYVLASGSGKVFIQSDVTNNPNPFATHPEWHAFFDQDPDVAEKTRRRVYDMVVAEKLQVQGFHYPFPGLGNVVKDGDGYRVIPAAWNPSI